MLRLNCSNKVTFNVHVSGTASTPKVRCVIGESPTLCFDAVKLKDDKFEVDIILPASFTAGSHAFKIEVLLNGRIFTPIQNSISVLDDTEQSPVQVSEPPIELPIELPKQEPTPSKVEPHNSVSKPEISLLQSVSKLIEPAKPPAQQVSETKAKPKSTPPTQNKNNKISLPKFEAKSVTPVSVSDLINSKPLVVSRLEEAVNKDIIKLPPRKVTQAAVLTEDVPTLVQGALIYL